MVHKVSVLCVACSAKKTGKVAGLHNMHHFFQNCIHRFLFKVNVINKSKFWRWKVNEARGQPDVLWISFGVTIRIKKLDI